MSKPQSIPAQLLGDAEDKRKKWKVIDAAFRDAAGRMAGAIQAGDLRLMQTVRRTVETEGRRAGVVTSETDNVISRLRKLQDAPGFSDPAHTLDALVEDLCRISAAASAAFTASKKLMDAADKRIVQAEGDVSEGQRQWARADAWLRRMCQERGEALAEMQVLRTRAEKAVEQRDAKALADAQKAAKAMRLDPPLSLIRQRTEQSIERQGRADPELAKQYASDAKAWRELLRGAEADEMQMGLERDAIVEMAIAERDARKAAKLLGIAGGDVAQLAKVLEADGSALLKGLEALGRQLKLAMPAKDMFAALRRAQLV